MSKVPPGSPIEENRWGFSSAGVQWRLFLTCWVIYTIHFSPFVVRELYLTISLAENHSVRVDQFADLHPDLFTIPGRGTFLGHNPGSAILAAGPYWLFLPIVNRVAPVRPVPPGQEVSADYKESRNNRLIFYRKVRERGIDVRLGLAAMITTVFFMAPLTALGSVVMYRLLLHLQFGPGLSVPLTLLFGLGTPMFFRAGTLSLNLIVALFGLFAFVLILWPSGARPEQERWRYFAAGLLAGWGVVTDYTAVITVGMLGLFAIACQLDKKSFWPALKGSLWFAAGAIGPILFMLFWQWYCFGNPWLPAQFYGPKQYFSGYPSERGVGWPLPAALWGLLFDPLYGLLVFAPIFALVLYHPVMIWRKENRVSGRIALFSWMFFALLYLFCSCIHYTVRHQWQDGLRYLIPAVPFLFLLLADVLARIPRSVAYFAAFAALVETFCLSMVRESPLDSMVRVLLMGPEFPWLTTLQKAAAQYYPEIAAGTSPVLLLVIIAVLVWGIWAVRTPWKPLAS
jgi:hypothetical protein